MSVKPDTGAQIYMHRFCLYGWVAMEGPTYSQVAISETACVPHM